MFCRKCGIDNPEGARYCRRCGEPLEGSYIIRRNIVCAAGIEENFS